MEPTTRTLPLLENSTSDGCSCCTPASASSAQSSSAQSEESATPKETDMNTQTYSVNGMTCGHCEQAVTGELKALDGVSDVSVDLVAGGTSSVTVTSSQPLAEAQIASALDEAGNYQLA